MSETTVRVEEVDGKAFVVSFPYDGALVRWVKGAFDERRYANDPPRWIVPVSGESAKTLLAFAAREIPGGAFAITADVEFSPAARALAEKHRDAPPPDRVGDWNGGMIDVSFPYKREATEEIRELGQWDRDAKVWRIPLSAHACRELQAFGAKFGFFSERDFERLAQAESYCLSKRAEARKEAHEGVDTDLKVPDGLEYYDFQKAGIARGLARDTLIADEPGLGKTIQTVGVWNNMAKARRALIICPKSLVLNWRREWRTWSTRHEIAAVIRAGDDMDWVTSDVVIAPYSLAAKHADVLKSIKWDLFALDEAHYLKNQKAQRTLAILGGTKKVDKETVVIPPIEARRTLMLTGTPILNRPVELFPLAHRLDPERFPRFFQYGKRYCAGYQHAYGWDFTGASNLDELNERLEAGIMIRRRKSDVLKELPAKVRSTIPFDCEEAKELWAEAAVAQIESEDAAKIAAIDARIRGEIVEKAPHWGGDIGILAKIRHRVAQVKMPHVAEMAKVALENGKVVVFAHHRDVVEWLADELEAEHFHGGHKTEDRQAAIDKFQKDEDCRAIVISTEAGGEGHTLTASHQVIFAEQSWTPSKITQAEDRCHRIGQENSLSIWHPVVADSIEEKLLATLVQKQNVIDKAIDGGANLADDLALDASQNILDFALGFDAEERAQEKLDWDDLFEKTGMSEEEKKAEKKAKAVPAHWAEDVLLALRTLSSYCDGALERDGMGFNRHDTGIGKRLAKCTPEQLDKPLYGIARRIAIRYQRQLDEGLVERLKANDWSKRKAKEGRSKAPKR